MKRINVNQIDIYSIVILISVWFGILSHSGCWSCPNGQTIATTTPSPTTTIPTTTITKIISTWDCNITSGKLYYSPACPHCQQELAEGGIESLQQSHVSIQLIDVTKGNYPTIQYVPTWIVNNQTIVGYQTMEQIKMMFQCG